MAESSNRIPRAAGLTLVELMVAMAITAIIAVMSTQVYVSFLRDDAKRRKITDVQGRARVAFDGIERDLRHASLGAGTGRIWTRSGANRVARPAVQIFDDVTGDGSVDVNSRWTLIGNVKPRTDALLVIEAIGGARAATVGDLNGTTVGMPRTFKVTTLTRTSGGSTETLATGDTLLVGDYLEATWVNVESVDPSVDPPTVTVTQDFTLPGNQVQALSAGAIVRRARARLYYVDERDQLIRLELTMPRAPAAMDEIAGAEIVATGVENLQLECEVDGGTGTGTMAACGGPLASSHEITTESQAFFGTFSTSGGPILEDASTLRTVAFNLAARSPRPLVAAEGDPAISLQGVQLTPGEGGVPDGAYVRRAYQVTTGIRNTSLGAF
jgi:prepilin-type N-terminal cleavage/methylation domain-containing protein